MQVKVELLRQRLQPFLKGYCMHKLQASPISQQKEILLLSYHGQLRKKEGHGRLTGCCAKLLIFLQSRGVLFLGFLTQMIMPQMHQQWNQTFGFFYRRIYTFMNCSQHCLNHFDVCRQIYFFEQVQNYSPFLSEFIQRTLYFLE